MPYINGEYQTPSWVNEQPPAINESELNAINTATFSAQKSVGEMLLTLRTVSDTDYILCDGSSYDTEAYPQLAEYLPLASSSAYSFPNENILGMKVATSLNGNYMARATCEGSDNLIQLYDRENDTWVTFNHDWGAFNGYFQDIVINDNGLLAAIMFVFNTTQSKYFITIDCSDIYNPQITYSQYIVDGKFKANQPSHIDINNSGVIVRYEEKDSSVYKFNPNAYGDWIEVTYPLPYYASAERFIRLRLLENGACFLAFTYKEYDNTISLMMYYRASLEHIAWQSIINPPLTDVAMRSISVDMNNNGTIALVCYYIGGGGGGNINTLIYICEAYGLSQWVNVGGISIVLVSVEDRKVSLNDDGILTFYNGSIFPMSRLSVFDINTRTFLALAPYPYGVVITYEQGAIINNRNTAIGYSLISNELVFTQNSSGYIDTALATDSEDYVATGGTNTITSQTGIYININGAGKVPNASDMGFGTFTLADLGNLYIRASESNNNYVAWANNSTKLNVANLNAICGSVEDSQLQIGDYILTTKTNVTFRSGDYLLCDGSAITEAQYPTLYPLVVAKFGNANLPNFEANGISGIHLYVRAK